MVIFIYYLIYLYVFCYILMHANYSFTSIFRQIHIFVDFATHSSQPATILLLLSIFHYIFSVFVFTLALRSKQISAL